MSTILTDSMARDHAASMQAAATTARRARAARRAARAARNARPSERRHARPLTAMHDWFVAGQL